MRETIDELKALAFGKRIAKRLIAKHSNLQMVFTYESIGDQCMELAYLRAFQQSNNIGRVGVLTTNPSHAVFKYFSDAYDELIQISEDDYRVLLKFYKSDLGQRFRSKNNGILCAFYTAYVRSDLLYNNRFILLSTIEKLIYRISLDTMPSNIKKIVYSEWRDNLISNETIVPGKTILMNPYANSFPEIPMSFFEKLANLLSSKGYKVLTGLNENQMPIAGTEGIVFPLEKSFSLVSCCEAIIGLRSGFLDLCSFFEKKIVSIDNSHYKLADSTRLEDWWPQNSQIKTFRYLDDDDLIFDIYDYIQEGK